MNNSIAYLDQATGRTQIVCYDALKFPIRVWANNVGVVSLLFRVQVTTLPNTLSAPEMFLQTLSEVD